MQILSLIPDSAIRKAILLLVLMATAFGFVSNSELPLSFVSKKAGVSEQRLEQALNTRASELHIEGQDYGTEAVPDFPHIFVDTSRCAE
ncbi:MAG: hypothetical protein AB4040_21150 [Synechococcus sp.]